MDGDQTSEKVISNKMKELSDFIENIDDEPPVKHKINWLCGKCKKKSFHRRRVKEPPHLKYMLKCRC